MKSSVALDKASCELLHYFICTIKIPIKFYFNSLQKSFKRALRCLLCSLCAVPLRVVTVFLGKMEEMLQELVSSSSGKQSLNKRQLYFNLNSARNWIQPNALEISHKLKKSINFIKGLYESNNNGIPGVMRDSSVTKTEKEDSVVPNSDAEKSKEILSAILLLDALQQVSQEHFQVDSHHEEFVGNFETELIEFITPPDGLAMSNLEQFVLQCGEYTFDMTPLAISVLLSTGNLASRPAKMIACCLRDEILSKFHNESEDVIVDPVECSMVLRLLYQVEESEGCEELQEYLLDYVEQKLYLEDDSEEGQMSPDAFLYFLSTAVAYSNQETLLRDTLIQHLRERLAEGFGFQMKSKSVSAADLSMRIIALQLTGMLGDKEILGSVTAGELKSLLKMQDANGSWQGDVIFKFGDHKIGGPLLGSLLGAGALNAIIQSNKAIV